MKNYYIERNEENEIISTFARPQYEGQEKLKETDKRVIAFFKKQNEPSEAELNEQKIQDQMRQAAIESLQSEGELPADFEG